MELSSSDGVCTVMDLRKLSHHHFFVLNVKARMNSCAHAIQTDLL